MSVLSRFAANWQNFLPPLAIVGTVAWIVLFRGVETSDQALFVALLVIYFLHQIEEHLWPGGFRQFTDARNWPFGSALAMILLSLVLLAGLFYLFRARASRARPWHSA